jgi:flagellar basal-body rod protein FlgB
MTEGIEGLTTRALAVALDVATLRHQVTATNVANAQTVGYVPQRVSFDWHLTQAMRDRVPAGNIDPRAPNEVLVQLQPQLDSAGRPSTVKLDEEMVEMSRNAVHYQALVKGLTRHFAVLQMAAADGRR